MTFDISGYTITLSVIVLAVAAVQWIVCAATSAFSRAPKPKTGLRTSERRLLISSIVLAAAWLSVFGAALRPRSAAKLASAAATSTARGSCSRVTTDMDADTVRQTAGKPDEIRADEEARGPGAAIWIYRDSRCAVHIFDGKVEFIE